MTPEMTSFLKSLGINEPSYFDMDFEKVGMDSINPKQVNMFIKKVEPWSFNQLKIFLSGIKKINYPYLMRFNYDSQISIYDATNIVHEYIKQRLHIFEVPFEIEFQNKNIIFKIVKDGKFEKYKALVDELILLFKKIEYMFNLSIEEQEAPVNTESKTFKKIEKEAMSAIKKEEEGFEIKEAKRLEKEFVSTANQVARQEAFRKQNLARRSHGNYEFFEDFDHLEKYIGKYVEVEGEFFTSEDSTARNSKGFVTIPKAFLYRNNQCLPLNIMETKNVTEELMGQMLKNSQHCHVRILGLIESNKYSGTNLFCQNIFILPDSFETDDTSELKRVELHLHTNMSILDGLCDISDYVKLAKHFGHKAIAVTDHGVCHSFPAAQIAAKEAGIKMIYGSELYMVDDHMKLGENFDDRSLIDETYVVYDLETTGFSKRHDRIIEFGAVKVRGSKIIARKDILINPEGVVNKGFVVNHISDEMLEGKPTFKDCVKEILDFIGEATLVSHNADFDFEFLNYELLRLGLPILKNPVIDTLALSHLMFPERKVHRLKNMMNFLEIRDRYNDSEAHRADFDAEMLYLAWEKIIIKLNNEFNVKKLSDLLTINASDNALALQKPTHVTVLCKNPKGLKALYILISESHTKYFNRVPCVLKSLINKYREDLIVMSSCFNGDVFQYASSPFFLPGSVIEKRFKSAIHFYDYIEIQPLANYSYLIDRKILSDKEQLVTCIKKIIDEAERQGKKVVATSDCHYCYPSEKDFRNVLIGTRTKGGEHFGQKHPLLDGYEKGEAFNSPDQYFRPTQDMLDCFKFLSEEKAKEYVITNSNLIADQCEELMPVKDKLFTPTIPNSEEDLKKIVYENAKEMYGENINPYISERIDKELNGIISHGYAVLYMLAIQIVREAHKNNEIVGSRGSVGSSLVAMLSGISEVNPLPPHYWCPNCKHFEFADSTQYLSGFDLPEKKCPVCQSKMKGNGQNIPFETFLGFNAEKVPDIDLNFSHDFQGAAHDYLKKLFGDSKVYRAGTIGTIKDKTSFAVVKDYFRNYKGFTDETMPNNLINYYAFKVTGVKRTTGAHPGGIIIIPKEFDVYDFTPVQYPGDNEDKNLTTHFDFHKIHDTILKLDLLGHDDPKILKLLCETNHMKLEDIPVNDKKVFSLFNSPDALGLKNNYLNFPTGTKGVPEFGTKFVEGVLVETLPSSFGDLLILSGLTHGTDVWQHNAELLVKNEHKKLRELIGCRDDIMTYLLSMKVKSEIAFKVMEDVRKGRKVKPDFEKALRACKVPDYYIDSCNKIKYMFPKAHATAYVTMAVRTAYFKLYNPLSFYGVYFSVRSDKFDIETMVKGAEAVLGKIRFFDDLKKNNFSAFKKTDEDVYDTLVLALEMLERGYSFEMVDFNRSDSMNFLIDEKKKSLLAPFRVLPGLGEAVGNAIVAERNKNGLFKTQKEITERVPGFSTTTFEKLKNLGACRDLPESNQVSLFDL